MPKRTQSFRAWQLAKLSDPQRAASYLNAAYSDSKESFLIALGKVAQANQMARVAKEAGVQRETLYRSLSSQGNPTFDTLSSILTAIGVKIDFSPLNTESASTTASPIVSASKPHSSPEKKPEPNLYKAYGDFNSLVEKPESAAFFPGNEIWRDQGALYAAGSNC
jgi:probable addiction module antidote protein